MKDLQIQKTTQTPEINFNAETGQLCFTGRSLPEDSARFYQVVFEWISKYFENLPEKTEVTFELDYFNTSSAKAIFSIIVKLDELYKTSYPITIKWFFDEDDEDMKDLGTEYQELFTIPISLIAKIDE